MKKNLLLVLFIMITTIASAQFTIWEDDFDDADASDWTLLDRDGNGSNWLARKNIQYDSNTGTFVDSNFSVLGTYNIDFNTSDYLATFEDNFAISPAIDASFYSGKLSLILNAQPSVVEGNLDISVYGSTSPDPATFTLLSTVNLKRVTEDQEEFADYTVDISQYTGETTVYIALEAKLNYHFSGYEIDKISVVAESLLGVDDVTLESQVCRINQNPVHESLELQLGEQFQNEETALKIYNANGILVKESPYKPENLSVSDLPQGLYFLAVTNNDVSKKIKFIKK
ncbi:T9SS type A sorting domain-containing protein [Flavobacterium pectinovorum]|uniref:T9SS-dependent choice-of-anchor J family protein n=1 Tax=Flavobacterium pectinovorum TaxID=29533 RepID=UPI00265FC8B2|nr:T9SS type A sorting domain-containing protein [Flavobacterium pectinovorum]WKL48788.1 T9SS type A sorting domain-containing protein [Flavobacterium pectinovorum]